MNFADVIPVTWVAKIEAAGCALVIVLAIAGGLFLKGRSAGVAAERPKVEAAQLQAQTATAQVGVTAAAAEAVDTAQTHAVQIGAKAEEAAHDVQTAPGASDALPADVLARWRAGVDGLRPGDGPHAADGSGGAKPSGAMPATGR